MNTKHCRSNTKLYFVLIAWALIVPIGAQAATINFNFPLEASQQVPPNGSGGTGTCNVALDDVSGSVSVSCSFTDLSTAAIAAHIHGLAPPGINAGVILGLTATAATSGTITGNGILAADEMTGVLDGLTYINLHTGMYPGGELRGQVVGRHVPSTSSVPATSTAYLMAMAALLLVLGGIALRRRSARN